MNGYLHPDYAASFSEFGEPLQLALCGGWILQRPIPGQIDRDAMSCYPLFTCQNWAKLPCDLQNLDDKLVSLAFVVDPLGEYQPSDLQRWFEIVIPFKEHYVVELKGDFEKKLYRNHRKKARQSQRKVVIELYDDAVHLVEEWTNLYQNLIERHQIRGMTAFSQAVFRKQLGIPGVRMFRAVFEGATIGAVIWYVQDRIAYRHLAAFNPTGYELSVSYALDGYAIDYFAAQKLEWLHLGGVAGVQGQSGDGLRFYKQGWSTGARQAYFCGRILNHKRYKELAVANGSQGASYFPTYRAGEFNS